MMPDPTPKSPEIEAFLEKNFGRTTAINSSKCVPKPIGCGRDIPEEEFPTWLEVERREYRISGLCNNCQQQVFGELFGD